MSEIVVVGSLKARPGKEDDARQVLHDLIVPTHGEDGCILYAFHQGVDDPARFAFVERWASREHLDAHLGSAHVGGLLGRVDELFAEAPDIVIYKAIEHGDPRKGALARAGG
jgi:quinol monooxygenase YgiN